MQEQLNITEEWVADNFAKFVRLNVRGGIDLTHRLIHEPVVESMINLSFDEGLVGQLRTPQLTLARNNNMSVAEQIYAIATHSRFRRGNYNLIAEYENNFLEHISRRVEMENPIRLTLPTLPFKDQNPLTTQRAIEQVDLGELLFFRQLGDLCESVKQVYRPGMVVDMVSDGTLYQKIFLDESEQTNRCVLAYYDNSQQMINSLGLENSIRLHNLENILEGDVAFFENRHSIRNMLNTLDSKGVLKREMDELSLGILFNSRSFADVAQRDPIKFSYAFNTEWSKNPQELLNLFRDGALAYSSFLLAMKSLDILTNYFPGNLRATVHPKNAAQIPLHTVNRNSLVAPYNGVPVVSRSKLEKTGDLRQSTRIVRYGDLISSGMPIARLERSSDQNFAYMVDNHS